MINEGHPSVICWNEKNNGSTFLVRNVKAFSNDVLPQYFRHSNFSSFVRQLNFYGFHKLSFENGEKDIWEFRHDKFKKGAPHLLNDIVRKTVDTVRVSRTEFEDLKEEVRCLRESVDCISHTNETLQQTLNELLLTLKGDATQPATGKRKRATKRAEPSKKSKAKKPETSVLEKSEKFDQTSMPILSSFAVTDLPSQTPEDMILSDMQLWLSESDSFSEEPNSNGSSPPNTEFPQYLTQTYSTIANIEQSWAQAWQTDRKSVV